MADSRASRDQIDAALGWVESLNGVVRLLECCRDLREADPGALSCLLGNIHDGLDASLHAAFRALAD